MNYRLKIAIWMLIVAGWIGWAEYRIEGLETRLNVTESALHWRETPSVKEGRP